MAAHRSKTIQEADQERIAKLRHLRLARECAKLDKTEEQALADEVYVAETEWPEY